jgi:hypothetical protein
MPAIFFVAQTVGMREEGMSAKMSLKKKTDEEKNTRATGMREEFMSASMSLKERSLQHTSAYVSVRQHTSAYVSVCDHVLEGALTAAYVSTRQRLRACL